MLRVIFWNSFCDVEGVRIVDQATEPILSFAYSLSSWQCTNPWDDVFRSQKGGELSYLSWQSVHDAGPPERCVGSPGSRLQLERLLYSSPGTGFSTSSSLVLVPHLFACANDRQ